MHAENAYVPNKGSGTVTAIDAATDEATDEPSPRSSIPQHGCPGKKLRGVALDLSGRTLFVVDALANVVLAVDTASGCVKKTLPNILSAEGTQLSPDGRTVTACAERSNEAIFIDVASLSESFRVKIQGCNPEHRVYSPTVNGCLRATR